ncbi:MAG: diterpene synthase [Chloroflexi bacterium]|nr:diterpene synthase [Chloroflexota bacterium]
MTTMQKMEREKFLSLPTEEIAGIIRSGGSRVCVFPFNGTRRWFLLEHGRESHADPAKAYIELTSKAYIKTYKMLFDYGLDTIIAPIFGGELLNRGDEYMEQIGAGLKLLAKHPYFVEFYERYDIRVHFYGDYRKELAQTPYAYLTDVFDVLTHKTAGNKGHRLFYGVFGSDATETIAKLSVEYHQRMKRIPRRRDLIELYYGEYIEKADIFIGFEKFNVFDYPLLGWGEESLYFTLAPSLYINDNLLRNILYDYVYLRPVQDPDYFTMPKGDFEMMRSFYEANREAAFGIGEIRGGIWYAKSNGQ